MLVSDWSSDVCSSDLWFGGRRGDRSLVWDGSSDVWSSDFCPGVPPLAHHAGAAAPDVGTGEERSVEQRRQSVVRQNRGARCLADEAAAEDALDRAARVIRPEAEEKSGAGAVLFQQLDQARYPSSGAAVGIDVDFESQLHSTSRRASATCVR